MAFGSFDARSGSSTLSEINMIPLIDVMLVLLVIFIITAPLLTHSIQVDVPQVSAQPATQEPVVVDLAITNGGALYWNDHPVGLEDLAARFAAQAMLDPQPEIRIRADAEIRYGLLARVMAAARTAGLKRLGFVTQPGPVAAGGDPAPTPGAVAGVERAPGSDPAAGS